MQNNFGRRTVLFRAIYKMLNMRSIVRLYTLQIIQQLLPMLAPILFMILVDRVMIQGELSYLKWVIAGYVLIYLLDSVLQGWQLFTANKLGNIFSFNIRYKIWKNITRLSIDFHNNNSVGDVKNTIEADVDTFEAYLKGQLIDYYIQWTMIAVYSVILICINDKLALIGYAMIPLSFWMTKWLGGRMSSASTRYRSIWGAYENWLNDSIQGWKEIKALNNEKQQMVRFTAHWKELSKLFFSKQMYWFGNRTFISFKDFFVTRMNLYFLGGILIINGELTIGSLILFMKYYEVSFSGIARINNYDMDFSNQFPSIQRVINLLTMPVIKASTYLLDKKPNKILFENVSFRYPQSSSYALVNVNVEISDKRLVAVVGRSGSGKSSFAKLLLGLYKPEEGQVYLNGVRIDEINKSSLHKQIGVVMQESQLFNMTIKENLMLSKPTATDEEIWQACRMANIEQFIKELPSGLDTYIGEKGVKLSGGQRQRIAIARTLLRNPSIIIFDESTSQLDNVSEKKILYTLKNLAKEKTVIIIAHRYTSVISAERVIVFDDGQIVGDGKFQDIATSNHIFNQIFNIRTS